MEEGDKIIGHGVADLVDGDQVGHRGVDVGLRGQRGHHRLRRVEMQRQKPCRRLAHLADAKREDHPFKGDFAPRLDGGQEVGDRGLAIAVKFGKRGAARGKPEDIRRTTDPP